MSQIVWDKEAGKAIEVSDEAATAGVAQGRYKIRSAKHVIYNAETGKAATVDAQEVAKWIDRGWQFATDDQRLRQEAKDRPVAAALIGAADMATAGAVTHGAQLLDELAVTEDAGPTVRAIREENPAATVAGQLTTLAASLPATAIRGTSAAAQAAKAATAVPRAITAAGRAAETAVAGLAEKAHITGLAQRVLAKGAGAATEGAFYGAAQGMTEADLGDPAATAERIVANVGMGSAIGAGLGGALPLLGSAIDKSTKATGRAFASLFETTTGTPAIKGVGAKAGELMHGLRKRFHAEQADVIDEIANKEARQAILGPEVVREHARTIATAVDKSERALARSVRDLARARIKNVDDLVKAPDEARALSGVANKLDEIDATIAELEAAPHLYGPAAGAQAKKLRHIVTSARTTLDNPQATAAKGFTELNRVKQAIDNEIPWRAVKAGLVTDPYQRAVNSQLIELNGGIRTSLESAELWGTKAANYQRDLNDLIEGLRKKESAFRTRFATPIEKGRYAEAYRADPKKIATYLKADETTIADDVLAEHLSTYDKAIDLLKRLEAKPGALDEMTEGASALRSAFGEADRIVGKRKQIEALAKAAQQGPLARQVQDRLTRVMAGSLVGGLPGAVGAAVIGEAIDSVANPFRHAIRMAQVEQMKIGVGARIRDNVRAFFAKPRDAVARVGRLAEGRRAVVTGTTLALLSGTQAERSAAVVKKVEELSDYQRSPQAVYDRVQQGVGPFSQVIPSIVAAMSGQISRNANYLLDVAPKAQKWPAFYDAEPTFSDMEISKFARQMLVAEDPMSVLDLMQRNELTTDETQALRAMYPSIYEDIRMQIVDYAGSEGTENLSYSKRVQLGILFDLPMDPSMTPELMQALQAPMAAQAPAPSPAGPIAKPAQFTARARQRIVTRESGGMDAVAERKG